MGDPQSTDGATTGIDYTRLYDFRFRNVATTRRERVWAEIAPWLHRRLGRPDRVLDAAAGRGEFINAVHAPERWAVDVVDAPSLHHDPSVKTVIGNVLDVDLPVDGFDGILVSNLLEHFASQDQVGTFLRRMHRVLAPGGRIAVLGPNFRYCADNYFDCADHTLALTHRSVEEHLHAAGFDVESITPKVLPFTFAGRLPAHHLLVRAYLRFRPAWWLLGKQFLVIGRRSA